MSDFDTVLHPDHVVPIMPRRQVLSHHSVALKGGQIGAILPRAEALLLDAEHTPLPGCALMPGPINLPCPPPLSPLRG